MPQRPSDLTTERSIGNENVQLATRTFIILQVDMNGLPKLVALEDGGLRIVSLVETNAL